MLLDLHSNVKASRGISPIAAINNNTAFVSQIVDTLDFGAVEFLAQFGAVGNGTFTALVEDGNAANLSDAATVDAAFLVGTTTLAPAANQAWKIGYIGPKRYVRVTITPAGNSGNIFLAGTWLQGHPRKGPQSTQLV